MVEPSEDKGQESFFCGPPGKLPGVDVSPHPPRKQQDLENGAKEAEQTERSRLARWQWAVGKGF